MAIPTTTGLASSLAAQAAQLRPAASETTSTAPAAAVATTTTATAPAPSAGTEQAASGAAAAQPAEAFNAPMLDLPDDPSTTQVLDGLVAAMADPSVNASSAQQLYAFHEKLLTQYKETVQVVLNGLTA